MSFLTFTITMKAFDSTEFKATVRDVIINYGGSNVAEIYEISG